MSDASKVNAMSVVGVRRGKAAFFSGCKSHPATIVPAGSNQSSHGGNEVAEASGEGPVSRGILISGTLRPSGSVKRVCPR